MNWLIVTQEQQTALDAINASHPYQQCTTRITSDGIILTTDEKIGVEYWADWQDWLKSLTPFNGTPVWPVASTDVVDNTNTNVDTP